MKNYVAFLDFQHLDHPVFLKSFAQSLSQHKNRQGIIIHGDSEYTNRLMQTGMMREDARKRAIMDLNRRLVALFADHGISTIGLQSYQKELISRQEDGTLKLNHDALQSLPETPMLLLSSLINDGGKPTYVDPIELIQFLSKEISDSELVLFSQHQGSDIFKSNEDSMTLNWGKIPSEYAEMHLSEEQLKVTDRVILTTPMQFSEWPKLKNHSVIE